MSSSCPDTPAWQDRCFSKAELMGDAGGDDAAPDSDAGAPGSSCPGIEEVTQSVLSGYQVTTVSDNGDRCCYHGYYPCEGRPLLQADEPVLADTVLRGDWLIEYAEELLLDDLAPDTRSRLARAWARDAAFEHASIASFAHFMADLLSFGAPLELVREAERALADEVRHAELCYELASRYAGRPLGPGPLAVPAFRPRTLREVALATLDEGCIAETQAAYAARQRLASASDPAVRSALQRIVADEERHAELAFRFVRWALDREPAILPEIVRAFDRACAFRAAAMVADLGDAAVLHAHGQLLPAERQHLAQAAIERIIEPCRQALVSS